ncbi:hypothetical protein FA95DRAFT_1490953 [Auriscalpium vulgare]|uniref:Uncharacterized protein n=1 Tax=Auriscalpium vulgare TaxID=40419 RepID=A0ACB8RWR7_9AGAM|nr:hypothetical protein FA95DRAFT_1490953 [Auriscalpium vulgare]
MAQQSQLSPAQLFKTKQRQFLQGLANVHNNRKQPLPPALTGVPYPPGFDPHFSKWSQIEVSGLGTFSLAGRDVDLFKLWNMVHTNGGGFKFQQENLWDKLLPQFDLPELYPVLPGAPVPVAKFLAQVYMAIVMPFEDAFRKNTRDHQQRVAAAQQIPQPGPSSLQGQGLSGTDLANSTMTGATVGHTSGSVPPTPQAGLPLLARQHSGLDAAPGASSSDILSGAGLGSTTSFLGQTPGAGPPQGQQGHPPEQNISSEELEGRKRKASAEEEAKRSRQKTSPSHVQTLTVPHPDYVDRGSAPPSGSASSKSLAPGTPMEPPQPGKPQRRKIEYLPLVREVDTAGGRDLHAIAEEHARLGMRRPLRDISEWGNIDVEALTMSIRSRIATELSYGLTTFTLLSIMRGQGSSGFPIMNCPELMDEVLDLAVEVAFDEEEDSVPENKQSVIITHKELVTAILDDGNKPFAALEKRQGIKARELGHKQRPGDIVLTIVNIMRNLSVVPDNFEYLAHHERLLGVLLRLCGLRRHENGTLGADSSALTLVDLVSVRRDVLYLLINLGGVVRLAHSHSTASSPSPSARQITTRAFSLVASFLVDSSEAVSPHVLMIHTHGGAAHPTKSPPPPLVDAALEVFTRLGQPDINRQVILHAVQQQWLQELFEALVHRLPIAGQDFDLVTRSEAWLSYIEKIVMAIYAIAFLAPPALKLSLKTNRRLGFSSVMLRLVKRFTVGVPPDTRNYLIVTARRAIEALKVLDDGEDSFDTSQNVGGAPLSFGVGYGEVGEDRVEKGTGLLGGFQDEVVWGIMAQKDLDDGMFRELESLARVGQS